MTVQALAKATNSPRFAYDAYRRLLDMFGDVVLGIPHESYEEKMDELKAKLGVKNDVDFTADQLKELVDLYKQVYKDHNITFPEYPFDQLRACIKAVFGSWNSERAIKYREIKNITGLIGTACNIQTMVFGNLGGTSGTGVAFSRDPGSGKNTLMGEYLINAQGEDVVAGIRTPQPISQLKEVLPEAYSQFIKNIQLLGQSKKMENVHPILSSLMRRFLETTQNVTLVICKMLSSQLRMANSGCFNAAAESVLDLRPSILPLILLRKASVQKTMHYFVSRRTMSNKSFTHPSHRMLCHLHCTAIILLLSDWLEGLALLSENWSSIPPKQKLAATNM